MEVNERMQVLETCETCGIKSKKTVVCSAIKDGIEHRLYVCDDCGHNEDRSVPHVVTIHDKIRKNERS